MGIITAIVGWTFELVVFALFIMLLMWVYDIKVNTEKILDMLEEEYKNKSVKESLPINKS